METWQLIILIPALVMAFAVIGVGIYAHGKRKAIYEEYRPYFGLFKAYIFLTCFLFGLFAILYGVVAAVAGKMVIGQALLTVLLGIACLAIGVLIGYFTNKKALANGKSGAVKAMLLAACGSTWHIEVVVMQICFFWLLLRDRKR